MDQTLADDTVPSSAKVSNYRRVSGFPLFLQQSRALIAKNALLAWRNRSSTVLQLGSSLFFVFLIFCVDRAVRAGNSTDTSIDDIKAPKREPVTSIPACETGYFIRSPCYDLLWSGNASATILSLVQNISNNNPGRRIDFATKTLGFATPKDVDSWLLQNPYHSFGALHFQVTAGGGMSFGLQANSTAKQKNGIYEDVVFKFLVPMQMAAEREIARYLAKDWSIGWSVAFTEYAHPAIYTFSAVASAGPTFLFAAAMFGSIILMGNLVLERELKLRQAMTTMGLMDSVYWLTWLAWEVFMSLLWALLLVLFGMMFQFDFFITNNFLVVLITFCLFSVSMVGFSFAVSTFISKAASAPTIGFIIFIIGFITQLITVFDFPYDKSFSKGIYYAWSLFPPNLLALSLKYLGEATATSSAPGVSWKGRRHCSYDNSDCVFTMSTIWGWMGVMALVYFVLAVYLDNILPNVNGVRKPCYYFLMPSYWLGRSSTGRQQGRGCSSCCKERLPPVEASRWEVDADVVAEEALVKEQMQSRQLDPSVAVSIQGLVKTFPATTQGGGCCRKGKRVPAYHAVKGLWMNVEKGKILCLLGPNGAGKSTSINLLTGIVPCTSGDALIYGDSVRSPVGMAKIRSYMGVCPQFDILWAALTGREHLRLFASIKGLPAAHVKAEVEQLLQQVQLAGRAASVRAGSYSGGMKRRLSVAAALIGDPQVVFLDEPTTGMDPVTRRHVWDIIEASKPGRAIVLTTHSMEEADILGDRIAIMARGSLRCLGTAIRLKTRFGAGYAVSVSVRQQLDQATPPGGNRKSEAAAAAAVKDFFKKNLDVEASEENQAYIKFLIPHGSEAQLPQFFATLRNERAALGISDLQVSLSTLEEVFLTIARQAELETAQSDGRYETLTTPDGTLLNVPVGAQYVSVPGTATPQAPSGQLLEVIWQQDDSGALRIADFAEVPDPRAQMENPSNSLASAPPGAGEPQGSRWRRRRAPRATTRTAQVIEMLPQGNRAANI